MINEVTRDVSPFKLSKIPSHANTDFNLKKFFSQTTPIFLVQKIGMKKKNWNECPVINQNRRKKEKGNKQIWGEEEELYFGLLILKSPGKTERLKYA